MSIHDLRRRFVKDNKFKIPVIQSPYFEYYLSLYDKLYNSESKYNEFMKEFKFFVHEDKYLKHVFQLTESISENIKNKEAYQRFNTENLNEYNVSQTQLPVKDIFKLENNGKSFISIDLQKANFNSLRHYDPSIIDDKQTYEDFMKQFTNLRHVIESKYIRQVIFGKLNPKRINKIEKFITNEILNELLKIVDRDDIKYISNDEIVINNIENEDDYQKLQDTVFKKSKELNFPIHFEQFKLVALTPHDKLGFVKEKSNSQVEFKSVGDIFFAQAYKQYFSLEIQEEDLLFYHEGQVCKFLNKI